MSWQRHLLSCPGQLKTKKERIYEAAANISLCNLSGERERGDYSMMVNVTVWHHRGPLPDIKLISGWSMVDIFYISSIQRLLAGGQVWPVSTSKEKSPDLSGQELVQSEKAPVRYHKHLFSTFLHLFINWRRKIKKMLPKALMTQALTALTSNVGLL